LERTGTIGVDENLLIGSVKLIVNFGILLIGVEINRQVELNKEV